MYNCEGMAIHFSAKGILTAVYIRDDMKGFNDGCGMAFRRIMRYKLYDLLQMCSNVEYVNYP